MEDPYSVIGVPRDASEEAIRKAYRRLAKKHHPDLNPGKPDAADQFKRINAANDILSDAEKRGRFDRGEIDAEGNERPPERGFYRDFNDASAEPRYGAGMSPEDIEALFGQAFGGGFSARGNAQSRGRNATYSLTVSFIDAAAGAVKRLTLPDGRTLDVTIPEGTRDGHVLRLKGQGNPGLNGGPAGDALVEIGVASHPFFRRDGNDVHLQLPVTLQEAVLGTTIEVPTIKGDVRVTVPAGSGHGTKLRLRGRGIHGGNQVVELDVVVPPGDEPELAAFLKEWKPRLAPDPRAALRADRRAS
jgi:DnaJ-class molecular chaperone